MTPTDEQLLQDVEGVLELCCEVPAKLQQAPFLLNAASPSTAAQPAASPKRGDTSDMKAGSHSGPAAALNGQKPLSSAPQAGTDPMNGLANGAGKFDHNLGSAAKEGYHGNVAARDSAGPSHDGHTEPVGSERAAAANDGSHSVEQLVCNALAAAGSSARLQPAAQNSLQPESGWEAGAGQLGCRWLVACLELWDGACWLMRGRAKPPHWLAALLKAVKSFKPETRVEAAALAEVCCILMKICSDICSTRALRNFVGQVTSEVMSRAQHLWGPLKPQAIKPIFEAADVAPAVGRETKRRRL